MRGCTVSAPVQSCNIQLLTSNNKYAAVQLLTKQTLYFIVEAKSRGKELYAQTCVHLSNQGMLDGDLFGLAIVSDGEYLFVDPDNKLSKYASKGWKSSNSHGLDSNNCPTLVFYFRVQFYVDTPLLLRDEVTRHHYYLQLRDNVLSRGLVHACSSREALYVLAGYALQADYGDYDSEQHKGAYFNPHEYFPTEIISSDADLEKTVPALHRENRGVAKAQAELQYISEASSVEASPLTHNAHLYRLKHKKQDSSPGAVLLTICIKGIEIYEENSAKALTATFLWNNIGKLCFDRKKFEIRALNSMVTGEKFTYFTSSDDKSKHLFFLCRVTHQFSMAIQPRLSEVKRQEEEDRKRYRDCYMYSRSLGPGFPSLAKFTYVGRYKGHHSDQRISVISNTSSNTTSGIVSDRVQSLDESEDDLELEIMINSPPAPSEESLAFAHLRDSEEERPCVQESQGEARKQSPRTTTATPATTDGSQCSSSCSTVVVASTAAVVGNSPTPRESDARTSDARRRTSTSSSLELGYSHTAQNSVISDTASTCLELDYSVQSAHTSSGVYTLRSSNTVESRDTNARSSETSGVVAGSFTETSTDSLNHGSYSITNISDSLDHGSYSVADTSGSLDCVSYPAPDNPASLSSAGYGETNVQTVCESEMRERSGSCTGSIVSTSGSFRGDGSDPSDCGPRNLLSAEELSDLIVGNGSSEIASGIYPCRGTVSSTMDSDSDYVTVPPPPLPPPRTDSDANYVMLQPASAHDSTRAFPQQTSFHQNAQKKQFLQHQTPLPPHHFQNFPHKVLQQNQMLEDSRSAPAYGAFSHANIPLVSEEANARFITTKPHINITTAHTTVVPTTSAKSYAAPTIAYQAANIGPTSAPHLRSYSPGDARTHPPTHLKMHGGYPVLEPGANMKASPLMPVIGKNNYLDVHASYLRAFSPPLPPPPTLHSRQPPPPPPTTVYTSQVTRGQIEQFRQQMYSDVDYVIYPMKDPAISKQEYMDAKQGSLIARAVHYPRAVPPPPYPYSASESLMYRSTPNVATVTAGYMPLSYPSKCASNQNLTSENYFPGYLSPGSHYSTSTSPLYSAAASYSSSSTQSLRLEPLPHHQRRASPIARATGGFPRAKSDDNLLNTFEKPSLSGSKYRRLPPPPPPPPYDRQGPESVHHKLKAPIKKQSAPLSLLDPSRTSSNGDKDGMLDIRTLREKSKNLDLPLISALCNDRSLLKQTKAFVMPRHPSGNNTASGERPLSWHLETPGKPETKTTSGACAEIVGKSSKSGTLLSSLFQGSSKHSYGSGSSKLKYPVSGLSTTQMCKPQRRVSASTHTHPCQSLPNAKMSGHGGTSLSVTKHTDAILP